MATQQPIVLCMDNSLGEEVAVRVEPEDDFQSFLDKAKGLLGLEVDINLITGNQHVSLTENMYQFLLKAEQNMHSMQFDQMLEPNPDSVYVLDDGTQIRASQIQFDNDDPVDFAIGNIPFVKYTNDVDSDVEDVVVEKTVDYNIIDSPVAKRPDHTSSPQSFANSLPFKLVCTNTTAFENQFAKYVETKTYATLNNVTNRNKSPRSLIRDNYTKYDDSHQRKTDNCSCTREEILNMFKDSPVNSLPYEGYSERRHVRKSDPSRIHKSFKPLVADLDGVLISENGNQICFNCDRKVDREKIYLFDNEDQKIHRKSPQKKTETQLKIICEKCLSENFTPCSMKGANQFLNPDEYLVIRNNQQYIFKKIKNIDFKTISRGKRNESKKIASEEFVKVEIGSDGEIITKPIYEKSDDVIVVRDRDSSSDVEIIEPEAEIDTIINNLEDADEQVKEFLGKYQCDGSNEVELKCRFCEHIFSNISEVIEHGEVHKQDVDDDPVFPCPLCNYGYAHFKWLKGHLMAAHEKKSDDVKKEVADSDKKGTEDLNQTTVEVKCEAITEENPASSDDEIWIVQTADADVEGTDQLQKLLDAANVVEKQDESKKTPKCLNCSQIFPSLEALATHRCRRRGRKRKSGNDSTTICVPTQQDFIKRAQGRPRQTNVNGDNSIIPKPRKKKSKEPSSDPQIVTCDNCNESFTSKVRLKFHMQFHESTPMLSEGRYRCVECAGAVFGTETALFDHVHFQHDKLKRWQCPVHGCGKTFHLRATLTKHSRTHTDTRRYVCVTCGKRFLDKQTLDEHGVTHLQIKPFQCHICLKQLTRRSRLRMHVRAHEEELAPRRVLVCAVCRRAFRDAQHAQEHATKSTECIEAFANDLKVESDEATVQLSPTSGIVRHTVQILESPKLSKPIPRQVDSPLAQPLLSQVTDEGRSIIRVVEIEKAFRCEYCEDVFYLEDSLNSHRAIHKGVRNPFTCHICKVSFATYSRVTTHKTTHGFYKRSLASAQQASQVGVQGSQGPAATGILGYGDFPVVKHFLCEDCGRSYLHWTYLQVHRRMKHANENYTYACNQCELTFPNSSSVGYHRKKVHGKTGPDDPPAASSKEPRANYRIPCRDCDEVLPSKTALYKHRKKEHCNISCRPGIFCCGTCGKQYGSRAGLEAHLLTHSGNAYDKYGAGHSIEGSRQFRGGGGGGAWRCPWCGARCATRAQLRTHLRHAHTATRAVIEIEGWNPTPEDITRVLAANNISQDKVVEITKISFSKGTSSIVPDCPRALALLSDVPRTRIACGRPPEQTAVPYPTVDEFQSLAHNRLMSKNLRRPKILQRGGDERPRPEPSYPLSVSVTGEELSDLSMQLLLRDGVLVDGSQMVQLHRNDSMLLE